jgi:hypothetical protein
MKTRITLVLIAAIALTAAISFPTSTSATHSWGGYHWARTSNPFNLKLGDNLTATDWKSYLSKASSDWNSPNTFGWSGAKVLNTQIVAGSSNKRCAMVAGTTQVCNGKYGYNGWLGLASINITGGTHITQGSAKMNDSYFASSSYNNPNEKLHVMCQELAHTFGLDHQSEDGSSLNTCMDYFSNTGANATSTKSTRPNYHDFEELALIYQHLDSSTTLALIVGQSTGNPYFDEDAPQNWGRLVSQSANGRSSTYEIENWDGTKKVTHVFWTEEFAERCVACDHRYDH